MEKYFSLFCQKGKFPSLNVILFAHISDSNCYDDFNDDDDDFDDYGSCDDEWGKNDQVACKWYRETQSSLYIFA